MQRLIFEFQRTCDNNLSFETFKHKIDNQIKTFERQKISLDSLLGFENTKRIQEKKKRDEMKQKKEEMEKKKKEDEEKQKRKEERAKKKKEEEQKKKEEESKVAAGSASATQAGSSISSAPTPPTAASIPASNTENRATPLSIESKLGIDNKSNRNEKGGLSDDLLKSSNQKDQKDKEDNKIDSSMISNSTAGEKRDYFSIEKEEKLDISENNLSILAAAEEEAKKKQKEGDDKAESKKEGSGDDKKSKDEADSKEKDKNKKEEANIGEAIMSNDHYEIFKKFNKIAGGELITVPETFLPDQQMKSQRQKAMNNVLDIDSDSLDYLSTELQNVRTTFEHFKKLVETIKRLDDKVLLIEKSGGDYLAVSEDDILEYIKDYLVANQIAEQFIVSIEFVRQTPFFEDFFEKIVKYMETLTQMLKKRFYAFATIEENCLTINYSYLKTTMTKFSTLNLAAILGEIYTDLNSQILKFMLNETVLLFETSEEDGAIKKYRRLDDTDEALRITEDSTPDNIREYMDVFQNNAEKYFQVLLSISKIITSTPLEAKLEELQDYLENKMESLMKQNPEHYQKQAVLDILKKFDNQMNKLNDAFFFDMKGMADNIETTKLEEILKKRLLSLKNQMYTQMKALKDCSDKEDYNFFQEIILEHFLHINRETQKVVEKKKGHQNKRSCLEVIIMNYQLLSSLIELFESDTDNKSLVHYTCLVSTVRAVKEYFQSFIDLDVVLSDEVILQKALHTFTDIQFLECSLTDSESKYQ